MLPLTQGSGPGHARRVPRPTGCHSPGPPSEREGRAGTEGPHPAEVSPDAVGRKRPAGTTLPPPGLGDTGAAGHMEPLLAPHPQCPWRRLSLSLSFSPVRWPRRCPTG